MYCLGLVARWMGFNSFSSIKILVFDQKITSSYVGTSQILNRECELEKLHLWQKLLHLGMDKEILMDLVTKKMPFGKYKGKLICDIPEDYLVWMNKKGFPEGKLGMWLNTLYEIRLNGLEDILYQLKKMRWKKAILDGKNIIKATEISQGGLCIDNLQQLCCAYLLREFNCLQER